MLFVILIIIVVAINIIIIDMLLVLTLLVLMLLVLTLLEKRVQPCDSPLEQHRAMSEKFKPATMLGHYYSEARD